MVNIRDYCIGFMVNVVLSKLPYEHSSILLLPFVFNGSIFGYHIFEENCIHITNSCLNVI